MLTKNARRGSELSWSLEIPLNDVKHTLFSLYSVIQIRKCQDLLKIVYLFSFLVWSYPLLFLPNVGMNFQDHLQDLAYTKNGSLIIGSLADTVCNCKSSKSSRLLKPIDVNYFIAHGGMCQIVYALYIVFVNHNENCTFGHTVGSV